MCTEKPTIVFLATSWGTENGGLNSFNTDLCSSFATLFGDIYEIVCVVPFATTEDISGAKKIGVRLIEVSSSTPDELDDNWSSSVVLNLKKTCLGRIIFWIGHDVKTGFVAIGCSKLSENSRSVVIHHMDYQAYAALRPENTHEKISRQQQVLSNCDILFAVGPLLEKSAIDKVENKKPVNTILPGLPKIEGVPMPKKFSAIIFGRLDPRTDQLKQSRLAVASFAKTCKLERELAQSNPFMTVIGLSEGEAMTRELTELHELAQKYSGRAIQIHGWPYLNNRAALFDELKRHSVSMMTSIHEGFGLTGWEAIAAEVPLVISENSGLYAFIDEYFEGFGPGCLYHIDIKGTLEKEPFNPEDVEVVTGALREIYRNPQKAKRKAIKLKGLISEIFTWNNCAMQVARTLGLSTEKTTISYKTKRDLAKLLGCSIEEISLKLDDIENFYNGQHKDDSDNPVQESAKDKEATADEDFLTTAGCK